MKLEIIRMKRRTMVLKIEDSQHAVLKVPFSVSAKKVDEFLQSKANWLKKNTQKIAENEGFSNSFDFQNVVYLNGAPFMDAKDLTLNYASQSAEKQESLRKKFYLSQFNALEQLCLSISQRTGLACKSVKPTTSSRVWGSCNVDKIIKLNWKLAIVPTELAQYVVCHELCHTKHMNHKPQFWAELKKICPNYKALKKQLERYSFLLKCKV